MGPLVQAQGSGRGQRDERCVQGAGPRFRRRSKRVGLKAVHSPPPTPCRLGCWRAGDPPPHPESPSPASVAAADAAWTTQHAPAGTGPSLHSRCAGPALLKARCTEASLGASSRQTRLRESAGARARVSTNTRRCRWRPVSAPENRSARSISPKTAGRGLCSCPTPRGQRQRQLCVYLPQWLKRSCPVWP